MKIKYLFLLLVLSIFCFSCSKKDSSKISIISEKNIELQILESYREGLEELEGGDASVREFLIKSAF